MIWEEVELDIDEGIIAVMFWVVLKKGTLKFEFWLLEEFKL